MLENRGAVLAGLGIGAGLMYFLDPDRGRRRRALVRDQVAHAGHLASEAAAATTRDASHRMAGVAARVRGIAADDHADNDVLVERVRAQLGRVVSHPRAIDVLASDGIVTLRGPILREEVGRLCRAVENIKGVRDVVNELDEHDEPGNVPALQGESRRSSPWRGDWSRTTRLLTALVATAGAGLLARAATTRQ